MGKVSELEFKVMMAAVADVATEATLDWTRRVLIPEMEGSGRVWRVVEAGWLRRVEGMVSAGCLTADVERFIREKAEWGGDVWGRLAVALMRSSVSARREAGRSAMESRREKLASLYKGVAHGVE